MPAKRDVFRSIPTKVFDAFGDVAADVVYHARVVQQYTPGTKHADTYTDVNTRAMRYGFGTFERSTDNSGTIKAEDFKLGFAGQELGLTPKVNDQITLDGAKYNVERVLTEDPYEAFHILHVSPI